MYNLYPRLPLAVAESLAYQFATVEIATAVSMKAIWHSAAYYAPTGGNRVSDEEITALQKTIHRCAINYGYPSLIGIDAARAFDTQCGICLFEQMHIHPSEASHLETWAFLTTILAPDVVRWRFAGERTTAERFIGSDRGLRRNTFGRLWWRVYLLQQFPSENKYKLFDVLFEDDLVQLTERNTIASDPQLLTAVCTAFLKVSQEHSKIARRMLMRESIKRIRRLVSIISFSALDTPMLHQVVTEVVRKTAQSLEATTNSSP